MAPPKQTYGKRAKPNPHSTNYAKFLIPEKEDGTSSVEKGVKSKKIHNKLERESVEKDEVLEVEKPVKSKTSSRKKEHIVEEEGEASGGNQSKPRSKKTSSRKKKESEEIVDKELDIEVLEKGMEGLMLEGVVVSDEARKGRDLKESTQSNDWFQQLQAVASEADEDSIIKNAAEAVETRHVEDENKQKKGKPRKALGTRDGNVAKKSTSSRKQRVIPLQQAEIITISDENEEEQEVVETKGKQDVKEIGKTDPERANQMKERRRRSRNAPCSSTTLANSPNKTSAQYSTIQPTTEMAPDIYSEYVEKILPLTETKEIVPFSEWSTMLDTVADVSKIAEASFSEVYRLTAKPTTTGDLEESVIKLIALKTPPNVPLPSELNGNGRSRRKGNLAQRLQKEREEREAENEWKTAVDSVHSEVRLLDKLDPVPGFTKFLEVTILKGRPSESFSKAWTRWNKSKPRDKKSQFPDPSKKDSYDDDQLWAAIDMKNAGTDCGNLIEAGGLSTIWEVWDVFWNMCLSLCKAEETCDFEHRDLHMDNICIQSSVKGDDLSNQKVVDPIKKKLGFTNLETTIIDYTISRADMKKRISTRRDSESTTNSSISASDDDDALDIAYCDMEQDPGIFTADASEEYQYEIYRYMRGAAFYDDPLKNPPLPGVASSDPNTIELAGPPVTPRRSPRKSTLPTPPREVWKKFHPKTNLLWAHFILFRLLENLRAHGNLPSSQSNDAVMKSIANPGKYDPGKIWRRANKMHKILEKVAERLRPGRLSGENALGSCAELVIWARECCWLSQGDLVGGE